MEVVDRNLRFSGVPFPFTQATGLDRMARTPSPTPQPNNHHHFISTVWPSLFFMFVCSAFDASPRSASGSPVVRAAFSFWAIDGSDFVRGGFREKLFVSFGGICYSTSVFSIPTGNLFGHPIYPNYLPICILAYFISWKPWVSPSPPPPTHSVTPHSCSPIVL